MNKIYFLFPVHNEEKRILNVKLFILWVLKNFKNNKNVFVFLLNNCSDNTELLIKKRLEIYPIKIIKSNEKNRGYGLNKFFKQKKKGYFAVCSVDNAWSFNFYKKGYSLLKEKNYEIIYGPKSHPKSKVNTNFVRKVISNFSKVYIKLLFGNLIEQDTQCIKIFKSDVKFLSKLNNYNYFAETEFYIMSKIFKNNITSVSVNVRNDNLNSKVNIRSIISYIMEGLDFRFRYFNKIKV